MFKIIFNFAFGLIESGIGGTKIPLQSKHGLQNINKLKVGKSFEIPKSAFLKTLSRIRVIGASARNEEATGGIVNCSGENLRKKAQTIKSKGPRRDRPVPSEQRRRCSR